MEKKESRGAHEEKLNTTSLFHLWRLDIHYGREEPTSWFPSSCSVQLGEFSYKIDINDDKLLRRVFVKPMTVVTLWFEWKKEFACRVVMHLSNMHLLLFHLRPVFHGIRFLKDLAEIVEPTSCIAHQNNPNMAYEPINLCTFDIPESTQKIGGNRAFDVE